MGKHAVEHYVRGKAHALLNITLVGQQSVEHYVRGQQAVEHYVRGQHAVEHYVRGQQAVAHYVRGQHAVEQLESEYWSKNKKLLVKQKILCYLYKGKETNGRILHVGRTSKLKRAHVS